MDSRMNIVEFLEARIAEDEEAAREACRVRETQSGDSWAIERGTAEDRLVVKGKAVIGTVHIGAKHIARQDPARVLAECKAKREILAKIPRNTDPYDPEGYTSMHTIRALAAVYGDHRDYDPEWRHA